MFLVGLALEPGQGQPQLNDIDWSKVDMVSSLKKYEKKDE